MTGDVKFRTCVPAVSKLLRVDPSYAAGYDLVGSEIPSTVSSNAPSYSISCSYRVFGTSFISGVPARFDAARRSMLDGLRRRSVDRDLSYDAADVPDTSDGVDVAVGGRDRVLL